MSATTKRDRRTACRSEGGQRRKNKQTAVCQVSENTKQEENNQAWLQVHSGYNGGSGTGLGSPLVNKALCREATGQEPKPNAIKPER